MKSVDKIKENIENLREKLMGLIQSKESLVDPEIVKASKLLDNALNEYHSNLISGYRQELDYLSIREVYK
jgi:iron-sulfur cluster repair protein YtfE (RIC family)